ncbi:hypothetical protein Z042_07030 [Chania multitudinisentens RB-25]|uniref:Uncharacterized protein n=1 Tax=Chania multitudinisentens RB-25 TaxID=1441930 RepID=W0LL13_9GAMM|nr:hypothetical protein [Chania multitudinisentens]AHG22690.1 hypothetical protein Z042_07030 [Chania multitudinisentens RB-25]
MKRWHCHQILTNEAGYHSSLPHAAHQGELRAVYTEHPAKMQNENSPETVSNDENGARCLAHKEQQDKKLLAIRLKADLK